MDGRSKDDSKDLHCYDRLLNSGSAGAGNLFHGIWCIFISSNVDNERRSNYEFNFKHKHVYGYYTQGYG